MKKRIAMALGLLLILSLLPAMAGAAEDKGNGNGNGKAGGVAEQAKDNNGKADTVRGKVYEEDNKSVINKVYEKVDASALVEQIRARIKAGEISSFKDAFKEEIRKRIEEKKAWKEASREAKADLLAKKLEDKLYINGRTLKYDVPPVIKDDRTLVPVRAISESLGADVKWDEATSTVTITRDGKTITLRLDNRTVTVDGKATELDVPPQTMNNRTMVPLRFVSEALGEKVDYDAETGAVDIGL